MRVLDRATGTAAGQDAEALIGADGLHSAVRAELHPDDGPLLWSGIRMWRGTAKAAPFLTGRSAANVSDGDAELIAYPIGRERINWVCLVRVAEPGPLPGDAGWNQAGRVADVLPYYARLGARLARCARPAGRLRRDPGVPDGRPGPAAVLGEGPRHPARRRRAPDVPGGCQRRVPGHRRRPGPGVRTLRTGRATERAGPLRGRAPRRDGGRRTGEPGHAPGRRATARGSWPVSPTPIGAPPEARWTR